MNALIGREDLRVWPQATGVAVTPDGKRTVRYGVVGGGDISGILADGRRLEIEVKTATGRQSPQQIAFAAMITKFNGVYILARSAGDVLEALANVATRRNP